MTAKMPKEKTDKCNSLNINALPPPIGEDKDSQATVLQMIGNPAQPVEKLSSYAIRLIRRLLYIADADFTDISFKDRDILEEALSGTSIDEIARRRILTRDRIRQRINKAIDLLTLKIEAWESYQSRLNELEEKVKRLEADALIKDRQIAELSQSASTFASENDHLRSLLNEYADHHFYSQSIILIDEKTKNLLHKTLRQIGLPPNIHRKFTLNNIQTVMQLISYTDQQLCCMEGITDYAVEIAKRTLMHHGLCLGSDIRWAPEINEYYIYPNKCDRPCEAVGNHYESKVND